MSSIRTETRALRRGFTLIEVMVAITITFILATVLYKLLASQTRFTALNSAQQEVQQNARGALEMIAADIRVTPSGGIATAGLNTVTLYVPKAFGILCTSSSSDMYAVFPVVPSTTLATGNVTTPMGVVRWDSVTKAWKTGDGTTSTVTQISTGAVGNCPNNNISGNVAVYRLQGSHFPLGNVGDLVGAFDVVQYSAGQSTITGTRDSVWVKRATTAIGSEQPLAGPLPSSGSLIFRYYTTATGGTPLGGLPLTNPTGIKRVTVVLTTRNRWRKDISLTSTDSVTVFLRNQNVQ